MIKNLLEQGQYHGQFRTGTTNSGRTAHIGGNRFLWEQRLFGEAYPGDALDRPKYGALNIFRYLDGASVRFGSCYFTLKPDVIGRCTFAHGDSSNNPTALGTSDAFAGILAGLLEDVRTKGRLLNQIVSSEKEALAILMHPCKRPSHIGRNLDYCIEAHVHGDLLLERDVDGFYVDESFRKTPVAEQIEGLCRRYGILLFWIPKRQVDVMSIGALFRGPAVPRLTQKIDRLLGGGQGVMHASLIGQAACDSVTNPGKWEDIGTEEEVFQTIKQLWHTVGYFG